MAPPSTHSAPFSQCQAVSVRNLAGLGVDAPHLQKKWGDRDASQMQEMQEKCSVVFEEELG